MDKRVWSIIVRVFNLASSVVLIAFQIWFMIQMIINNKTKPGKIVIQIFAPIFLLFIALLIVSSEFKYKKAVQYFKFLQSLVGLGMFNLFIASILSFEFSTLHDTLSIIVTSIYLAFGITFFVLACLKPTSEDQDYNPLQDKK